MITCWNSFVKVMDGFFSSSSCLNLKSETSQRLVYGLLVEELKWNKAEIKQSAAFGVICSTLSPLFLDGRVKAFYHDERITSTKMDHILAEDYTKRPVLHVYTHTRLRRNALSKHLYGWHVLFLGATHWLPRWRLMAHVNIVRVFVVWLNIGLLSVRSLLFSF